MSTAPPSITFYQAAPPAMPPGDYRVDLTQTVTVDGTPTVPQPAANSFTFTVAGPRFYLKPSEVYSVYPPAGHIGKYDDALPHIVFTRRSLPWERELNTEKDDAGQPDPAPIPWLALLLLSPDDFPDPNNPMPSVTGKTVNDLLNPGTGIQGPQSLQLHPGERDSDVCNTIDLPADLFAAIAPTLLELPLLSHVRQVDLEGKETLSLQQDGYFSVVLGNRLAATETKDKKGVTSLACLVSLEGFHDLLPTDDGNGTTTVTFTGQVRLAVLASWKFSCYGDDDFKSLISQLDHSSALMLPNDLPGPDDGAVAVNNAFGLGYAAINHTTRLGETTVSWYRGPLVPPQPAALPMTPPGAYAFISCADAALRYDPTNGLFATEYAGAYELGRLMALQRRDFAAALYRYRRAYRQQLDAGTLLQQHTEMLGLPDNWSAQGTLQQAAAHLLAGTLNPPAPAPAPALAYDPPPEVTSFLARTLLLYGVPFHYLVPDPAMLPPETLNASGSIDSSGSIRFFYLDPGWISALVQGATSVGRNTPLETPFDSIIRTAALKQALTDAGKVRQKSAGSAPAAGNVQVAWPLTGFLLRSPLVQGWQGLEMHAYDTNAQEIAPLRIDRLAPDVLLCLFNGEVAKLTVKQPPEGLHFGLSPDDNGGYERLHSSLRRLADAGGGRRPGTQFNTSDVTPIPVPLRTPVAGGALPRVVRVLVLSGDISQAVQSMQETIDGAAPGTPAVFTSAEFAVEMIEAPAFVTFTLPPPPAAPAP